MSCCARCGEEICTASGKIALNKVWHRGCFCCYRCNKALQVNTAKIFFGEVFCKCCYPQVQQACPIKVCRVNSTPSFNECCVQKCVKPSCFTSSDSDNCKIRDAHSCGCIPACCSPPQTPSCFPYNLCDTCGICDEPSSRRAHCLPRIQKPHNYPPRTRSPCCSPKSNKCRPKKCSNPSPPKCYYPPPCCSKPSPKKNKKMLYFQPKDACSDGPCCRCSRCCSRNERCRRCGEKVFAAEKILTACGAYHLGCFSCCCCCKSLCVKTMYEGCGEIYCKQCYNNFFGISCYGYCT